jgi:hypothetical protein
MAPRAWWGSSWFVESQYDQKKTYKTSLIDRFWMFTEFLVKKTIQNTISITLLGLKIMKLPPRNSIIKGFPTLPSFPISLKYVHFIFF